MEMYTERGADGRGSLDNGEIFGSIEIHDIAGTVPAYPQYNAISQLCYGFQTWQCEEICQAIVIAGPDRTVQPDDEIHFPKPAFPNTAPLRRARWSERAPPVVVTPYQNIPEDQMAIQETDCFGFSPLR